MTKITLNDISNLQNLSTVTTINDNSDTLTDAIDNTVSRDGSSPNEMEANIDMNSNRILNLPAAVSDQEPLRLIDLTDFLAGSVTFNTLPIGGSINTILTKNSSADYDFVWSSTINATSVTASNVTVSEGILVSHNTGSMPTTSGLTDITIRTVGTDGDANRFLIDAFGGMPNIIARRADGTNAAKTAVVTDDALFQITSRGYDGTNYTTGGSAKVEWMASSNWTATHNGAYIRFLTTKDDETSASTREVVRIGSDGGLAIGTTTTPGSGAIVATQAIRSTGTGGLGYTTGAGGSVTQAGSKGSSVTINKVCGIVTTNAASLAASTIVSFVMSNSAVATTDVMILNHISGGTPGAYTLNARCSTGLTTIDIRNNTGGTLAEAVAIQYALIKGVTT